MEYGLLQDIFPDWKRDLDGSIDPTSRKEQKKKSKKMKMPVLRYLDPESKEDDFRDPDRPFLPVNKTTAIAEETSTPGKQTGIGAKKPSYFGASDDDDTTEGFATFTNIIGDNPAYMLSPTNTEVEVKSILDKSTGGLLPSPSLEDAWKPLAPAGAHTSFFKALPPPSVRPVEEDITKKIDDIFQRLEQLETERRQSTQTEVLLFVGSGLVLLLSLDILSRKH
jgi:hypothetical protein